MKIVLIHSIFKKPSFRPSSNWGRNILFVFLFCFITVSLCGQHVTEVPIQQDVPMPHSKSQEQTEAEKQDSIKKEFAGLLLNYSKQIDELKQNLFSIDTSKASQKEVQKLITNYKVDLQSIDKKFNSAKGGAGNSLEVITIEDHFIDQKTQIEKKFIELQEWADNTKPPMNPLVILGITLAGILVFAMTVMPIIMKKSADKKQKKIMKDAEWQTLSMQYQQLPPKLEAAHLSLIENLISMHTNFVEKPPKKLHKKDALDRIKVLKLKKLKVGPIINITEKKLNNETDI